MIQKQRGLTLLELLTVIVITGLLLGLAIPSFNQLLGRNQLTTATNTLVAALALARSEAVKRSVRTTLCASADGVDCGGSFGQGWIVFVDPDGNGKVDDPQRLVRVYEPLPAGISAAPAGGSISSFVSYAADGLPKIPGGGFLSGRIAVCNADLGRGNCIDISRSGRSTLAGGCGCSS